MRAHSVRPAQLGVTMVVGVLLISAVAAVSLSLVPFPVIRARVDRLAPDGSADPFTPAAFQRMVIKLRLAGLFFGIGGVLCGVWSKRLAQVAESLLARARASARWFWVDLGREMKSLWREDRPYLRALAGVTLLGLAFRLPWLNEPLRYDEAVTFIYYALPPWYVAISNYTAANNHVLHTLFVHVVAQIGGDHPWVLRLPALGAGLAMVPMTYLAVRQLYHAHAALLAAGLVAASSLCIEYSTSARGYTLWCVMFLIALALGSWLRTRRIAFGWGVFALICALGFYTIPLMVYPFGFLMTWLLLCAAARDIRARPGRSFLIDLAWATGLTGLLTVVLYAPILVTSGAEAIRQHGLMTRLSWPQFVVEFRGALEAIWSAWHAGMPAWGSLLLAIGVAAATVGHARLARHRVPLIVIVGLWCLPVLLLQRLVPYVRFSLFLLPVYFGVASAGLVALIQPLLSRRPRLGRSVVVGTALAVTCGLGLSVMQASPFRQSEQTGLRDASSITTWLKSYLREGDRVVAVTPSDAPLLYYFRRQATPVRYLYGPLQEGHRMIVVVNTSRGQTPESVIRMAGLPAQIAAPSVLQAFPSAVVYEFRPDPQ